MGGRSRWLEARQHEAALAALSQPEKNIPAFSALESIWSVEFFLNYGDNSQVNTVIADDRCRVKLPEGSAPGDRFDVSVDPRGRIVYRKLAPVPRDLEDVPLIKMKAGTDGLPRLVLPKGMKITGEMIARSIREERDSR